jgi:hypothetical protein
MSNFRDLIARMAIDAEFARHTRANPDAVARQYRLSPDESEQLRGLADAAASAGPTALGARLSKMGGLISSDLVAAFHAEPVRPRRASILADPHRPRHPRPQRRPDHDGIPNILDATTTTPTPRTRLGRLRPRRQAERVRPAVPGQFDCLQVLSVAQPDSDGDGIHDPVDSNDHNPDTSHEALGDNDHDGIPNYLDKFNFPPCGARPRPVLVIQVDPTPATRPAAG